MYNVPVRDSGDGRKRADRGSKFNGATIKAKTAAFSLSINDTGEAFSNKGAAGAITFTLPVPTVGVYFIFFVVAAQTLTIVPHASETVNGGATSIAAAGTQAGKGYLELTSDGTNWFVSAVGATWTTT